MKKIKKILSLVLVFSLIAAFMAGCSDQKNPDGDVSEGVSASGEAEATPSALGDGTEFDYDTASKFLSNDELIMTVNGYDIYWNEYFYWLKNALNNIQSYYGLEDWNAEIESLINVGETVTVNECVKELANDMAQNYRVVQAYATELGVKITDEDREGYEKDLLANYESEEALQEELKANHIAKDTVLYMNMINDMYTKMFEILYGENGSEYSDEDVAAYVEENGYYQAKHILFATFDEESNELSEEEKAAKKQQAEDVLAMINDYTGDDIASYFQELMDEYDEDTGQSSFPDGYLCTSGTMVPEFEDAVNSLGDYEVSDIVETSYGYHIIMRLPISYDSVPVNDNYGNTLRYNAASQALGNILREKTAEAKIEYADVYDTIIPEKVFPVLAVSDTTDTSGADASGADASGADASGADASGADTSAANTSN